MKLLLDMNVPVRHVEPLAAAGFDVVHWVTVGDPRASDATIAAWARADRRVVVTHDLDFGALLSMSSSDGPSVIQVRIADVLADAWLARVESVLIAHRDALEAGALVIVDEQRARVRLLPLAER